MSCLPCEDRVQYLHERAPVIGDASAVPPSCQVEPAIPSELTANPELIQS